MPHSKIKLIRKQSKQEIKNGLSVTEFSWLSPITADSVMMSKKVFT